MLPESVDELFEELLAAGLHENELLVQELAHEKELFEQRIARQREESKLRMECLIKVAAQCNQVVTKAREVKETLNREAQAHQNYLDSDSEAREIRLDGAFKARVEACQPRMEKDFKDLMNRLNEGFETRAAAARKE